MIHVTASKKDFFFDRELVRQFMDAKSASALARGGGLIRRVAQNSMRSRKRASMPGQPPSRHVPRGRGLTRILYFFDPKTKTVVIGPVFMVGQAMADGTTVPQLQEFGGRSKPKPRRVTPHVFSLGERGPIREIGRPSPRSKRFARPILRTQPQVDRAQRIHNEYVAFRNEVLAKSGKYPARPFMAPALENTTPKLPQLWASAVQTD